MLSDPTAEPPAPQRTKPAWDWCGRDWSLTPMGPIATWPRSLLFTLDLIAAASQPMVVTWGPLRRMFFNASYAEILEGRPDAMGEPLHEVLVEAWDALEELFARAEAGEAVYQENVWVPLTQGGRLGSTWWTLSYSRIPAEPGTPGGLLCIVHETTRLYLAEERARAAQDELKRITDVVPSLLWRADRFGRPIWLNGRFRDLAEACGADNATVWRALVHPDDLDAVLHELSEAKAHRRRFDKAVRIKTSYEGYRWHQVRSEPIFDGMDAVAGWCGVATDIQDARDALETLDHRSELFRQFAANSSALLWVVDLTTLQIDRLSENFAGIWPDLDDQPHWPWRKFLASLVEADRPTMEAALARSASGEVVNARFRVRLANGRVHALEATTFPIFRSGGGVACVGGVMKDVTLDATRIVHLIDADPADQNRLSHGLRRQGFEVKTFDSVDAFAEVASGLAAAPVLYRRYDGLEKVQRLSGIMRTSLGGRPWLVIQNDDRPAREAVEVMKMGAGDILSVEASLEDLAEALSAAATSLPDVSAGAAGARPRYRLTRRELQVAKGLVAGGTNKSIAIELSISPRTVETHRSRLMERLEVHSLAELVGRVGSPDFQVDIIE